MALAPLSDAPISDEIDRVKAELDRLHAEAETRLDRLEDSKGGVTRADLDAFRAWCEDTIDPLSERLRELRDCLDARNRQYEVAMTLAGKDTPAAPVSTYVTSEPGPYRPDTEHSFFSDMWLAESRGDPDARDRLERHRQIETRDLTTGITTSLVPPAYLADQYAELARASRPFANVVQRFPMPDRGQTLEVPKVATGTSVASQATENTAVSETDMTANTISVPVCTLAGQQDVSRQLLERGDPSVDRIIFGDLAAAHGALVESQVLNGAGTSGTMLGVLNTGGIISVTYTDANPTAVECWPKIADAVQQVASQRFLPPDTIVMHPRRWAWFLNALDTTNRPLVTPSTAGPSANMGVAAGFDGANAGTLLGLSVVVSASMPTNLGGGTNEDRIVVCRAEDSYLWENNGGQPVQLTFDQPLAGQLTVKLVSYAYCAFTAARQPASIAVISGTGLATPTW